EVGGSVERVHIPAVSGAAGMAAAFFSDDGVLRKAFGQPPDDERFGGAVGLGDNVNFALVFHTNAAVIVGQQQGARLASDSGGSFKVLCHGLRRANGGKGRRGSLAAHASYIYLMSCLNRKRFGAPARVRRMNFLS